jgi:hypothetical protein
MWRIQSTSKASIERFAFSNIPSHALLSSSIVNLFSASAAFEASTGQTAKLVRTTVLFVPVYCIPF